MLKRLKLVALYEKSTGASFTATAGKPVQTEEENELPVPLPAASLKGIKQIAGVIGKMTAGPEHEILYTAILLQAIEFLIQLQEK